MTEGRVTHPRIEARPRAGHRLWWGKAWQRAVEEASFAEADLRAAMRLARGGMVGGITVGAGSVLAAVREGDDAWTVTAEVPVLDDAALGALVEVVAAQSRRLADLAAGDLPHQLVEDAEEAGVELLPYGGELATTCTCGAPLDPCRHGLAVLVQVGWLQAADPFVLLALRGAARDELTRRVGELSAPAPGPTGSAGASPASDDEPDALDVATDAALRASRLLADLGIDP
ncbi:hypothetical protein RDV89_08960 [Nocardioides zeae]|uniref:SWIM-type domain-containing protein n=1 Tax=Nocardioides imazamoxiresistens TaxID=3231893 RepID=A0ABU3PWD5_9ACTN|nr:hypothetical protein [Nocardioides zeae]MDT9593196.1 hypothetical protein [Nocardioides zeae]